MANKKPNGIKEEHWPAWKAHWADENVEKKARQARKNRLKEVDGVGSGMGVSYGGSCSTLEYAKRLVSMYTFIIFHSFMFSAIPFFSHTNKAISLFLPSSILILLLFCSLFILFFSLPFFSFSFQSYISKLLVLFLFLLCSLFIERSRYLKTNDFPNNKIRMLFQTRLCIFLIR